MYQLPVTLETPAANLALDEALLDAAVAGELAGDVLRLWEPADYFVVLGRSSSAEGEVRQDACRADGVPVLRRASGGATVLAGPGCLMFAVVLDARRWSVLCGIDRAHEFVLGRNAAALSPLATGVARSGTSDLTLSANTFNGGPPRKFSGNSLRLKREHLLYHGTILYDFPLQRVGRWLAQPARRPEYRGERGHGSFLTNFPARREALMAALMDAWQAHEPLADWPQGRTEELAARRYATTMW
jgi:lipoate---protein ligase